MADRYQEKMQQDLGKLLNLDLEVHPTMFDYCLAMALLYFREPGLPACDLRNGAWRQIRFHECDLCPACQCDHEDRI